jgi:hypothetical protein
MEQLSAVTFDEWLLRKLLERHPSSGRTIVSLASLGGVLITMKGGAVFELSDELTATTALQDHFGWTP